LSVSYDKLVSEASIRNRITTLGYTVNQATAKILQAQIGGMDCGGCAKTIEASLEQMAGVTEALVSFATGRLTVTYNLQEVSETAIFDRLTALGYTAKQIPVVSASDTDDSS
jgi:Cd2+/Zn2+-exporting ATPase